MDLTTMNITKPDGERFTRLRLRLAAAQGKQMSQQEYLAHAADILEHIADCPECAKQVHGHIWRR